LPLSSHILSKDVKTTQHETTIPFIIVYGSEHRLRMFENRVIMVHLTMIGMAPSVWRKATAGVQFPSGGKYFLFSIASRPALGSNQSLIQWVLGAVSSGIKRPGRESDHSPPSSEEVNNGGAVSPLPHTSS
jgi:hypothetical protein